MMRILAALAVLTLTGKVYAAAQPGNFPRPKDAEEIAKEKTDMVAGELGLDEKQYSKVYKLYIAQAREMTGSIKSAGFPEGMPAGRQPMRGGPTAVGRSGPRGGMSPGGGMRSRSGPDGISGHENGIMPPENMKAPGIYEEPEKKIRKREKKMKKILTAEQYTGWIELENEMRYRTLRDAFMNPEP
ncbi:MAG: hypothetical protein LIO77_01700 [Rikenellaceae bacterium]|nr:hypothetical protein [Rikenellaceae bacterium]